MSQEQFGFEDPNTDNAPANGKGEVKKDVFVNFGYRNGRGEEMNINVAISLEKKANALQELLVDVFDKCATEEDVQKLASELLGKLFVKSVWIKSKQNERKKLTLDDL